MINPLLELKEVSYKNKNNFTLNKISLRIKTGEKIALLGKSGSGKTTLIKISNGSLIPNWWINLLSIKKSCSNGMSS